MKKRFSDQQIISILREAEAGVRGQGQYVDEHSKQIYVNHRLVVILVVLTRTQLVFSLFISHLLAKAIPVRGAKFKKPA
jgi:hypothetical protein